MKIIKTILKFAGTLILGGMAFLAMRWLVIWFSPMPNNLGVTDGQLVPCPNTPNCVSSQATDSHAISALPYNGSRNEMRERLLKILATIPHLTFETVQPNYIHVTTYSPIMGFVDDNEFYLDDTEKVVHVRAAARLGRGDFDANRNRIEGIRKKLQ